MHSGATRPGCRHPLPALRSVAATLIGILAPGPAQAAAGLDGAGLTWFWALPFIGILLTIATGPLLFPRFWHRHYGKLAFAWSGLTFALPPTPLPPPTPPPPFPPPLPPP